jgi:WD40 repeat protein
MANAAQLMRARPLPLGVNAEVSTDGEFSRDGRFFAATSHHIFDPTYRLRDPATTFHVWDTRPAKPFARWKLSTLRRFALAPDGRTVAVVTGVYINDIYSLFGVQVRDIRWGKIKRILIRGGAIKAEVHSLAWSPDGKWLVTGSGDGLARVWNVKTGRRLATLLIGGYVGAVEFSPDSKLLSTVGGPISDGGYGDVGWMQLWNWRQKKLAVPGGRRIGTYSIYATLRFWPDGKRLAVGNTSDGQTSFYATRTLDRLFRLPAPTDVQVNAPYPTPKVAFSRDGSLMASVSGNFLNVTSTKSNLIRVRYSLKNPKYSYVTAIQWNPGNQLMWTTARELFNAPTGNFVWRKPTLWDVR